jgi:hypothetical protein
MLLVMAMRLATRSAMRSVTRMASVSAYEWAEV